MVHTVHTTATSGARMSTARCLLMGKMFSMRHQLILRKFLENFSKLKAIKFYNKKKKKITSIYKTYKRQKLVCVGDTSVLHVCMFVCEDVYVTFKTSYKHKTQPRNIWCAPHRSAARGAFICLYSTLPTRLWIIAWNKCELFRFEPKFLFIAIQNMKTWIFLDNSAGQYVKLKVYLFILYRTRKTCTFLNKHEKDYYCGEP